VTPDELSHAHALRAKLTQVLAELPVSLEVTTLGGGVQVKSAAELVNRFGVTHCFHFHGNVAGSYRGPEFLTYFSENGVRAAVGRSRSEVATASALELWFQGASLEALYSRFEFVDEKKRDLSRIQDFVLGTSPELGSGSRIVMLHKRLPENLSLQFQGETRSVVVNVALTKTTARFLWDETELYRAEVEDLPVFVSLLKRWICDNAMPSSLRVEFPWLAIGDLADFYESGNPVEGEFLQSWNRIETFCGKLRFFPTGRALSLIASLRSRGFDKTLRAGQSHKTLILSRSRRPRLRFEQPRIEILFDQSRDAMEVRTNFPDGKQSETMPIAVTEPLEHMMLKLQSYPVD